MNEGIINFYVNVVNCANSEKNCPNIIKNLKLGYLPRGFYTEGKQEDILILIVGKNPGHILEVERKMYKNLTPRDAVIKHFDFVREIFDKLKSPNLSDNHSLVFHKNLIRYMEYFLEIPKSQIFKKCVYTNLVKCSTTVEQMVLDVRTINECFEKHFVNEVTFFNPKIIIALGREVENYLKKTDINKPIIYIKHPSYYYRKDIEKQELNNIKKRIQAILKISNPQAGF